jgi:hypothetical protein
MAFLAHCGSPSAYQTEAVPAKRSKPISVHYMIYTHVLNRGVRSPLDEA